MTLDFEKFCLAHCCVVGCKDRMDYCPIADAVREQYGRIDGGTKCEKIYMKVMAVKENEI